MQPGGLLGEGELSWDRSGELGAESGRQMVGFLRIWGWEMGIGGRMAAANRFS